MRKYSIYSLMAAVMSAMLFMASFQAAQAATQKQEETLAPNKIVLQISDPTADKQTLVLNVVGNLLRHFGQDMVAIDVTAYGPGLRLLYKDNVNSGRIKNLAAQGVRFSACENTMKQQHKTLADLNPVAKPVSAGIVHIMELEKKGWTYARP